MRRGPDGSIECCFCLITVRAPHQSYTTQSAPGHLRLDLDGPGEVEIVGLELVPDQGRPIALVPRPRPLDGRELMIDFDSGALPAQHTYKFHVVVASGGDHATLDAIVERAYRDPVLHRYEP
jgi:hypothetical protein